MVDTKLLAHEYLLKEYEFMQREQELQFNHFMKVFEFWIAILSIPITAGILTKMVLETANLNNNVLGVLMIFIGILGVFISIKVFDIRGSQLRYIHMIRKIRIASFQKYNIAKGYRYHICFDRCKTSYVDNFLDLQPLDCNKNGKVTKSLNQLAREDFGKWMAITMSIVDSIVISLGVYFLCNGILTSTKTHNIHNYLLIWFPIMVSSFIFLAIFCFNFYCYHLFTIKKIQNVEEVDFIQE